MKANVLSMEIENFNNHHEPLGSNAALNVIMPARVHTVQRQNQYPDHSRQSLLKAVNKETLMSLKYVLEQLTPEEYSCPVPELSNTPIGKHVRHIMDFYLNLLSGAALSEINYDTRHRGSDIEVNLQHALEYIDSIIMTVFKTNLEKPITVRQEFGSHTIRIESTLLRELLYNLEHAIHHMALIKIGLTQYFDWVRVPANFGVAYSTMAATKS